MNNKAQARIAIDAMGGDHAPEEIVAGALLAAAESNADIILVGDESRVRLGLRQPLARQSFDFHRPADSPGTTSNGAERTIVSARLSTSAT